MDRAAARAVQPAHELTPLWSPDPLRVARANLTRFAAGAAGAGAPPGDYHALWRWSVDHPDRFWPALWRFADVVADDVAPGAAWDDVLVGGDIMAPPHPLFGPHWFTGARLNFAENLLRWRDDHPALVSCDEHGRRSQLTHLELHDAVVRCAAALRHAGVGPGDRVAGYLPNIPETVIAMLATASLGAIWSSCSPDFGVQGVLDRFGQIRPRVLVTVDGYRYAGKAIDLRERVAAVREALPSVSRVVVVPFLKVAPDLDAIRDAVPWATFTARDEAPGFLRVPFEHPLVIMFSSGTTGLPKCMVHGHGGTLLQHLKEHLLHGDLRREDRIFYFTTCGWMMWNWLVSALATGATVVLYDGAPMPPTHPAVLWDLAERERVSVFGTSAKFLAMAEKVGLAPGTTHRLPALRSILSTGSPLAPASYDWVYDHVKRDVQLASISGGTDIISCFALGVPTLPVWRGELQAPGLGMAVDTFDAEGHPVAGAPGDLVCTRPFPSMPVRFWNDDEGRAYRAAYFERFPGVWCHGDWAEWTAHGGLIITGRSDATLNPGGVRIGTAEIYRQVEQLEEVLESLVVAQEWDGDVRVVLFVRLREGLMLDDALRSRVREAIRAGASPHHVPRKILAVPDIPRTVSGKITELAVREMIHGRPVRNVEALANPQALEHFRHLPDLLT